MALRLGDLLRELNRPGLDEQPENWKCLFLCYLLGHVLDVVCWRRTAHFATHPFRVGWIEDVFKGIHTFLEGSIFPLGLRVFDWDNIRRFHFLQCFVELTTQRGSDPEWWLIAPEVSVWYKWLKQELLVRYALVLWNTVWHCSSYSYGTSFFMSLEKDWHLLKKLETDLWIHKATL